MILIVLQKMMNNVDDLWGKHCDGRQYVLLAIAKIAEQNLVPSDTDPNSYA